GVANEALTATSVPARPCELRETEKNSVPFVPLAQFAAARNVPSRPNEMSSSTSPAAKPIGGVNGAGAAPVDMFGGVPGHAASDDWYTVNGFVGATPSANTRFAFIVSAGLMPRLFASTQNVTGQGNEMRASAPRLIPPGALEP